VTGVILIVAIAIDRIQQGGRFRRAVEGGAHGPTSTAEPSVEDG
jgi:hypothetical protein